MIHDRLGRLTERRLPQIRHDPDDPERHAPGQVVLLAAAGTIAGGAGAIAMLKLAIAAAPVAVPRLAQVAVDVRLLVFALCVVAGTAILFGLLPALMLARTDATEALKDGTRGATGIRGHRWNRVLVVSEVALACAVLVASALLVRSVTRMINAPMGVAGDGVVTGSLQLGGTAYPDWKPRASAVPPPP